MDNWRGLAHPMRLRDIHNVRITIPDQLNSRERMVPTEIHATDAWPVFGELAMLNRDGLPWRDVDLVAGIIHVRQRADAWSNIGPPKSKAGKRAIPLAPVVVNALKQWKAECPKGPSDLVFPNGAGNVESLTNVWKRFWIPLQVECGMVTEAGEPRY